MFGKSVILYIYIDIVMKFLVKVSKKAICNGFGRNMVTCPYCIANDYCDVGNHQESNYAIMFNKFAQRNIVLYPYIIELDVKNKWKVEQKNNKMNNKYLNQLFIYKKF